MKKIFKICCIVVVSLVILRVLFLLGFGAFLFLGSGDGIEKYGPYTVGAYSVTAINKFTYNASVGRNVKDIITYEFISSKGKASFVAASYEECIANNSAQQYEGSQVCVIKKREFANKLRIGNKDEKESYADPDWVLKYDPQNPIHITAKELQSVLGELYPQLSREMTERYLKRHNDSVGYSPPLLHTLAW